MSNYQKLVAEAKREQHERALAYYLRQAGITGWVREVPFGGVSGNRKWRFDFAWNHPDNPEGPKLAVEVQGGMGAVRGAHARAEGAANDYQKAAEAQMCGFIVLHLTPEMIESGDAVRLIRDALEKLQEESE